MQNSSERSWSLLVLLGRAQQTQTVQERGREHRSFPAPKWGSDVRFKEDECAREGGFSVWSKVNLGCKDGRQLVGSGFIGTYFTEFKLKGT